MTYKESVPTFEALQWTGANLSAMRSFVDSQVGASDSRSYNVDEGNLSIFQFGVISVVVPGQGYLVRGPLYGNTTSQAEFFAYSDAEFGDKFHADIQP